MFHWVLADFSPLFSCLSINNVGYYPMAFKVVIFREELAHKTKDGLHQLESEVGVLLPNMPQRLYIHIYFEL